MKKIFLLLGVLLVVFSAIVVANSQIDRSDDIIEVEAAYGEDNITGEDLLKKVKAINMKTNKTKKVNEYDIDIRMLEIHMLSGLSEEEALEKLINEKKKAKALKFISIKHKIDVTDKEIEAYLTTLNDVLTDEQKELTAALAGFESFDEYIKSDKTIEATKLYFVEGKYVSEKMDKLTKDKKNIDTNAILEKAQKEVEDEIKELMKE